MLAMQHVCLFRFLVLCVLSVFAAPAAASARVWSLCLQSVTARCANVLCAHGSYGCTSTVNGRFGGFWRRGIAARPCLTKFLLVRRPTVGLWHSLYVLVLHSPLYVLVLDSCQRHCVPLRGHVTCSTPFLRCLFVLRANV